MGVLLVGSAALGVLWSGSDPDVGDRVLGSQPEATGPQVDLGRAESQGAGMTATPHRADAVSKSLAFSPRPSTVGSKPRTPVASRVTHGGGVVCVELGWGIGDPRAEFVAAWNDDRARTQRRALRHVKLDESDHRRPSALRSFDDNTERLRRQLVDRIGAKAANRVLRSYRLHRYDATNQRWLRLDALGNARPVPHDDEVPTGYER